FSTGARQEISETAAAIKELGSALPDVAEAVRTASKIYTEDMDDASAKDFEGIGKGLEDG
ncbi:MAG: hypothetical protein ACRDQB_18415, partial [Thermocrispum sp.]